MNRLKKLMMLDQIKQNAVHDATVSFAISFLFIIDYSFYRHFMGFPFTELNLPITENYLKFIGLFILTGLLLFLSLGVFKNRSLILDSVLFYGGVLTSIVVAGLSPQSFTFCLILFLIMGTLSFYYYVYRGRISIFQIDMIWILLFFLILYLLFFTIICIIRHRVYLSYDLDLGYFDQTFYSLSKTLKPIYTLYGTEINHFTNNHFSPILYLLLPGYLLFQSPEYLVSIQIFFVVLAVIPLYKLSAIYFQEKKIILLICISFLLQPGIIGGLFYDFHENALLPFFLFWLLFFIEKKSRSGILIFVLLTIMIKEDVVIYVIAIGLFELLRDKGSKKNAMMIVLVSIFYFFIISNFVLNTSFFYKRYDNLIVNPSDGSYFEIIKILFTNPLYLLSQCFTGEKMVFLGLILLPLCLIPCAGFLKISEIVLFLPMAAINLLPSWHAQYSIDFQYNFGTIPLFIFICIRFISKITNSRVKNMISSLIIISTLIFTISFHIDKLSYFSKYREKKFEIQALNEVLKKIPDDASVSAASHFYPHLSERKEIYPFGVKNDTDYVIVDLRGGGNYIGDVYNEISYLTEIKRLISEDDYGVVDYWDNWYLLINKGFSGDMDEIVVGNLAAGIKAIQ